jgi:hypothetical protein
MLLKETDMALQLQSLETGMLNAIPQALDAAKVTSQDLAGQIKKVLPGEIKKLAAQLVAIEEAGFSQPLAIQLIAMQKESFEDVLIALFEITLAAVQELINALLKIVRDVVNTALGFVLL